ncbi:MFS-type transporter SLC18B1-like [Contarinia nasturtii]|uniref:MFS-type transporter SLC18B1-like n=1 Tax=Contarinia nasturtii TaxID=265458 RepID=UPI0012D37DFF|nr:MFS-type transporter SLC18B1-like [Contarinia nasturtii]
MQNLLPNFTKRQWLTLIIIGLADFCNAICVSLQAPFFPQEAEKKGCSATEYGLVFGVFELVVFIVSPLYGQYLNHIGPKVLFNGGIYTTGISAIFFGLLDRVQGHGLFITLAFIIRIIEALGNAAFLTASFAIIAKEFPDNVSITFASLETFFGLGLIVGPMVGGILYQFGGYFLPFATLGMLLFMTAVITMCVLPRHNEQLQQGHSNASILTLLKIPGMVICAMSIMATSASIGFLGATLEPHLRQFDLSPVLLGIVFIINGGFYAVTAPIWGWMVDKFLHPKLSALIGGILIATAFCLIGPVSFLPFSTTLGMIITGLVMHGFGIAAILVASFADALRTAIHHGFSDTIETYGLVSGLWTSTFAFGAFFGPSVSGLLYDSIGFRKAVLFIILLHAIVGFIVLMTLLFERKPQPYKELTDTEPLLRNEKLKFEPTNLNGSTISIDQQHTCPMTNVMVCSGLNHKNCQTWSSRYEQEGLLSRNSSYYGSCCEAPQRCSIGRETIA